MSSPPRLPPTCNVGTWPIWQEFGGHSPNCPQDGTSQAAPHNGEEIEGEYLGFDGQLARMRAAGQGTDVAPAEIADVQLMIVTEGPE